MSLNGAVLVERWCLHSWTHQLLGRLHQCWLELSMKTLSPQQRPAWAHLQTPWLYWSVHLCIRLWFLWLLQAAFKLLLPFSGFFFFFFCSCKVSIDVSVIHYIFLFVVCLFYFKCPGAPWRWPSHIKTSTCLVLHSAKHDSYLFSKLLPFSVMWDRSPSNRFLTHLLACAWTANPLALMMKMI